MLSKPVVRSRVLLPSVAVSPADGLTVSVTIPLKPLTLLAATGVDCGQRGIVLGPVRLQLTVTGVLGEIVKSLKLNVAVVLWVSVPLMPEMVTMNVPAVVDLQDTIAVPEFVIGDPVTVHVRPAGAAAVIATDPVNPLSAVTVTVDVAAVDPSAGPAAGELAAIVKSVTWKRIGEVV